MVARLESNRRAAGYYVDSIKRRRFPTIAEFVPGYEAIVWNGVVAPKDTSVGIINQLNSAFTTSLVDLQVTMTAAEFGKFVAEDTAKWGKVIQVANIKLG